MLDTLVVGLGSSAEHLVTEDMSPAHLPVKVLSTPSMVGLIEQTCLQFMQEHLEGTEGSVGTHICVSHVAAAPAGATVRVDCEVAKIAKGRFLTFDVSVHDGETLLGEGTHDRAVVDTSRFG